MTSPAPQSVGSKFLDRLQRIGVIESWEPSGDGWHLHVAESAPPLRLADINELAALGTFFTLTLLYAEEAGL